MDLALFRDNVSDLLTETICAAFIIEEQPLQVINMSTKLTAKVSLLVGHQVIPSKTQIMVKVLLLNENQIINIPKNDEIITIKDTGEIINNELFMEMDDTGRLSANFQNLEIKLKGNEINQKFGLIFLINVKLEDALDMNLWRISLPFLISAKHQHLSRAWASITWFNTFADLVNF